MVFSYAGKGRIPQFTAVQALGLISYSYNPTVGEEFLYLDFGSIVSDYWVIQNHANVVIQDYANSQIISLTESGQTISILDFGIVTEIEAVSTEDWGLITVSSNITSFGLLHYRSLSTWSVVNTWVGSGTVWEFGGSRFRLDAPWIGSGTLRVSGNTITHYVPNVTASGLLPLRSDTRISFAPNWNAFGTIFTNGFTSESTTKVNSATIYSSVGAITGAAEIIVSLSHIAEGTLFAINNAVPSVAFNYVGSGRISAIVSSDESVTWDYNPDSIVYFEYEDYGLVSNPVIDSIVIQDIANDTIQQYADIQILDMVYPGSTSGGFIDHGNLLVDGADPPETLQTDWGYIWETYTKYPMGLGKIRGAATTLRSPSYAGSCEIDISGEGIGKTKPRWIAYVDIGISGYAITNFSLLQVGSGTLFTLSNASDSVTYTYSGFGDLYAFSGGATAVGFNPPDITTDIIFTGSASASFAPNWNSFGSITIDVEHTVQVSFAEVGSGALFSFDSKIERRTYSYNSSSEVLFNKYDYGLVSQSVISSIVIQDIANDTIEQYKDTRIIDLVYQTSSGSYYDYGYIIESGLDKPETVTDDYEFITENFTRYPFGDLVFVGAAAPTRNRSYDGSGSITIKGEGRGRTEPKWRAHIELVVTGKSHNILSKSYAGTGALYNINNGEEKVSFVYEGFGDLFAIAGASESTSSIPPSIESTISIGGQAKVAFTPNWNGSGISKFRGERVERVAFSEVGSGVLYNFNTLVERRVYSYNLSSIDEYVHTDYGLVSSPAIDSWIIQNHANVVIYDYRNEKLIDLTETGSSGNYLDYGHLQLPLVSGLRGTQNPPDAQYDYQYILDSATIYPFGRLNLGLSSDATKTIFSLLHIGNLEGTQIKITGEVFIRLPNVHAGSGTLFGFGGVSQTSSVSEFSTGLFKFRGAVNERFIPNHNGSGSVLISGVAQTSLTNASIQGGLYKFNGIAQESFVTSYEGFGSLVSLSGAAEAVGFKPPVITTHIKFAGAVSEKTSVAHSGYGVLFGYSGSSESKGSHEEKQVDLKISGQAREVFTPNWNGFSLIEISGQARERSSYNNIGSGILYNFSNADETRAFAYNGFGTLFGLSSTTESQTDVVRAQVTLKISGAASTPFTKKLDGSGVISTLSGAAESYTANVDNLHVLFKFLGFGRQSYSTTQSGFVSARITGTSSPEILTFAEQPTARVSVYGQGTEKFVPNWNGSGTIATLSGAAESVTFNPTEREILFSILGRASQSFSFGNFSGDASYRIYGELPKDPTLAFAESGSGVITIGGIAEEKFFPNYLGQGTIFSRGLVSESKTVKLPPTREANILLRGAGTQSATFNPPDITTEITISGQVSNIVRSFAEQSFVYISVTGNAVEKNTETYNGSGVIFSSGISGESVTRKLPEFTADISLFGSSTQSTTAREVFFGSLHTINGEVTEKNTESYQGDCQATISGQSKIIISLLQIGSGTIGTLSGAAESVGFNPPDITTDIKFIGSAVLTRSVSEVKTVQTNIFSEDIVVQISKSFVGSGSATIYGDAATSIAVNHIGSGTIATLSGAAESVTFNPEERQILFSILGRSEVRSSVSEVKDIQVDISGDTKYKFVPHWKGEGTIRVQAPDVKVYLIRYFRGDGTIATLSGAAESVTFNPEEKQILFSVNGISTLSRAKSFVGSGSIATLSGAAEAVAFNPPEQTALFNIEGNASIRINIRVIGSGNLFNIGSATEKATFDYEGNQQLFNISGAAVERNTESYAGFGSLFGFGGSGEAVGFNPPDITTDITIFGEGRYPISRKLLGSGNLFVAVGATESRTIAYQNVAIFDFLGQVKPRTTKSYVGEGSESIQGSADTQFIRGPYQASGQIDVTGESPTSTTKIYTAQGNVDIAGNAITARQQRFAGSGQVTVKGNSVIGIRLRFIGSGNITVKGNVVERFVPTGVVTLADLYIVGSAVTRKVNVAPQRTYGWII